jgi:hypothetical protein
MSKIRLILTVHNNVHNIKKIVADYVEYINDIIIYDIANNENTNVICTSLLQHYNIDFQYIQYDNRYHINTMQYIIDNNINSSDVDFLLLLDANDNIINLNKCLKQISNKHSYYECIIHYSNEQFMLRNKFLISTKYNWRTYNSNALIVNVNNDPNITGEYINNVWIKREYNFSLVNFNLIESEILNSNFEKELLFAIGKYYYNENNSKTGLMLNMFINSMNNVEDTIQHEYDKELLYYCYIILTKYYIKCIQHKDVIIDTIKKAIMIYPSRAEAYSIIGNYFYKIGNYNLCYYNLEKALSLSKIDNCYMCYQNSYSIEKNCNIIVASIILDKNESAFQYLKTLKNSNNTELYKYFIRLIKNNNLLST